MPEIGQTISHSMSLAKRIRDGIAHRRVAIYLKIVAVFLLLGASSHLASIMSVYGTSWVARPLQFRVADMVLLPYNLVVAWGLWRTRFWGVVGLVAGIFLLQAIPILFFTEFFATNARERTTLYGLLAVDATMLGILFVLLPRKKRS